MQRYLSLARSAYIGILLAGAGCGTPDPHVGLAEVAIELTGCADIAFSVTSSGQETNLPRFFQRYLDGLRTVAIAAWVRDSAVSGHVWPLGNENYIVDDAAWPEAGLGGSPDGSVFIAYGTGMEGFLLRITSLGGTLGGTGYFETDMGRANYDVTAVVTPRTCPTHPSVLLVDEWSELRAPWLPIGRTPEMPIVVISDAEAEEWLRRWDENVAKQWNRN